MTDLSINFVILSHGRQGTNSLYCDLNHHPQITIPNYDLSDPLVINGKSKQLTSLYPPIPRQQKNYQGILFHGFNLVNRLPGQSVSLFKEICTQPAAFFLFPRHPLALLKSSYKTYLQYWLALDYFKKSMPKNPVYLRKKPVSFLEFLEHHHYLTAYQDQIDAYQSLPVTWYLEDFESLQTNYDRCLNQIVETLGIKTPFIWPRKSENKHHDLLLEQIFSFSEKPFFNDVPLRAGLFRQQTALRNRGKMTEKVTEVIFENKTYDVTIHFQDKQRYQPNLSLLANNGDFLDGLITQFWHFKNHVSLAYQHYLSQEHFSIEHFSMESLELQRIKESTIRFIDNHPQFSAWLD